MEEFAKLVNELRTYQPEEIASSDHKSLDLASIAETSARWIAHNLGDREKLLRNTLDNDAVWKGFGSVWGALARSFDPTAALTEHELERQISLATALGKLERNLVAGLAEHQEQAIAHETAIRACIFNLTTFTRIEDPQFFTLQAILVQLLSNLISPVDSSIVSQNRASGFLQLYLSGKREDDVIIRLLDSNDPKVNSSTIHLLSNLIRDSPSRLEMLFCSTGLQWLSKLLDKMDIWLDLPPEDDRFELCTSFFNHFIVSNFQSRLFGELASPNEPISPSQTTFLKVLDSYLASSHSPSTPLITGESQSSPNRFLIPVFQLLSAYANTSMAHVPDDARLPKVFEALVLVSEALVNIGLGVQASQDASRSGGFRNAEEGLVQEMKSPEDGEGIVKPIVETIRALDEFLPRLNPRISAISTPTDRPEIPPDRKRPIAQLKRVLVQLLGVLTFDDKAVADQVRVAGGVQLVLGLTEVDEANPYLREHALFVVRNLMLNNPENQAIIGQMDPIGVLGENGEVLPVPDKMRSRANGTR